MTDVGRGGTPAPVVLRAPVWMRWLGVPLLVGTWLLMASPVVLAIRERDWMAHVRDSGLGPVGAVVAWLVVGVFLVVIPPAVKVLLTYRTVLDANGVRSPLGRGRYDLAQLEQVRWVPQGGPVNAANKPERFEILAGAGLVGRVTRDEGDWEGARAVLRHWVTRRPDLLPLHDDATAAHLGVAPPGATRTGDT